MRLSDRYSEGNFPNSLILIKGFPKKAIPGAVYGGVA